MKNYDIAATWKYHEGSKHSHRSIRNDPHFLDWANRPRPFKIYPKIEPLPLPRCAANRCGRTLCDLRVLKAASVTLPQLSTILDCST
jgi:hypothetical protein